MKYKVRCDVRCVNMMWSIPPPSMATENALGHQLASPHLKNYLRLLFRLKGKNYINTHKLSGSRTKSLLRSGMAPLHSLCSLTTTVNLSSHIEIIFPRSAASFTLDQIQHTLLTVS
uniref:Uncharacterized protein n=1 Tax=Anguilla anguilla TaxID=7936 RepID=A0A0E9X461_ANGAN